LQAALAAPEPQGNDLILTTQFSQFSLSPALMARLDANKFEIPTPVQIGCIPPALEGRDVLATAQTGTGKTLGYLIPIVEMMQKAEGKGALALIVLPTRELAMQVEQAFLSIRSNPSQTVALVVGGLAERSQLEAIRRGARLIVATPGRLEDYLKRKLVRLDGVKILVLDEVDRMLDMGFQPAIARIAARRAPDLVLLGHAGRLCQGSGAQVPEQPGARRNRLGAEAGGERRAADL
jgi:ATP-dependent RNA helicase RhlE